MVLKGFTIIQSLNKKMKALKDRETITKNMKLIGKKNKAKWHM